LIQGLDGLKGNEGAPGIRGFDGPKGDKGSFDLPKLSGEKGNIYLVLYNYIHEKNTIF
jgi:hypothetical protein